VKISSRALQEANKFSPSFVGWLHANRGGVSPVAEFPAEFVAAVGRVLRDEGGYESPRRASGDGDAGGETNFGISKREYADLDIADLTRDDAVQIYWFDWWIRFSYDDLPAAVAPKVFDLAINVGPGDAAIIVQRACRACGIAVPEADNLGPRTRAAAHQIASENRTDAMLAAIRSEAAGHYRGLALVRGQSRFLNGWLNRAYE